MAVPGLLSDYIIKNYKRLLVCVVPPPEVDDPRAHSHSPPHLAHFEPVPPDPSSSAGAVPPPDSFTIPPSPSPSPPRAHSLDAPHHHNNNNRATTAPSHNIPASPTVAATAAAAATEGGGGGRARNRMSTPVTAREAGVHAAAHAADAGAGPRWRRRRSTTRVRARRSAGPGPFVYMHDGDEFVREDPFRGCVSSRSVGPRSSGDFVVMGCMQV